MGRYAEKTSVSSEKSRAEIEKTLTRYGADGFMYGWKGADALVGFEIGSRRMQFRLTFPERSEFSLTETGRERTAASMESAYEQAVRQKWRALALVIKAKLEAVESGITSIDDEFMAHIVLPNGGTVGDFMRPQIERSYLSGNMPPLLPAPE